MLVGLAENGLWKILETQKRVFLNRVVWELWTIFFLNKTIKLQYTVSKTIWFFVFLLMRNNVIHTVVNFFTSRLRIKKVSINEWKKLAFFCVFNLRFHCHGGWKLVCVCFHTVLLEKNILIYSSRKRNKLLYTELKQNKHERTGIDQRTACKVIYFTIFFIITHYFFSEQSFIKYNKRFKVIVAYHFCVLCSWTKIVSYMAVTFCWKKKILSSRNKFQTPLMELNFR